VPAPDATVLTLARILPPPDAGPSQGATIEVVCHYAWTGTAHTVLYGALVSLLRETWHVRSVAVDATGVGEPVAAFLAGALGPSRVEAVKLSAESKSRLGYALLAAVNGGRLRLYDDPSSNERRECWRQLERCRAVYRANRTLNYFVEPRDGHDDYVISLALAVAAAGEAQPRRARGRQSTEEGW
jgi:phage FluMu gp28-like protein